MVLVRTCSAVEGHSENRDVMQSEEVDSSRIELVFLCSSSQTLTDDQAVWVKQTSDLVLRILRETPPDGELFTDTVTVSCHSVMINSHSVTDAVMVGFGGTAAAAPSPFRPGKPALCGSCPLVTPYYCRLGTCCAIYSYLFSMYYFVFLCVLCSLLCLCFFPL